MTRELRAKGVPEHMIQRAMAVNFLQAKPLKPPRPEQPGRRMNKWEAEFAARLEAMRRTDAIRAWDYEPMKLRLAGRTYYTPDFRVTENDGSLTIYEVKGFWRDDARVKIKVAAELHPCFRFVAVQKLRKKQGGGWKYEHIASSRLTPPLPRAG